MEAPPFHQKRDRPAVSGLVCAPPAVAPGADLADAILGLTDETFDAAHEILETAGREEDNGYTSAYSGSLSGAVSTWPCSPASRHSPPSPTPPPPPLPPISPTAKSAHPRRILLRTPAPPQQPSYATRPAPYRPPPRRTPNLSCPLIVLLLTTDPLPAVRTHRSSDPHPKCRLPPTSARITPPPAWPTPRFITTAHPNHDLWAETSPSRPTTAEKKSPQKTRLPARNDAKTIAQRPSTHEPVNPISSQPAKVETHKPRTT